MTPANAIMACSIASPDRSRTPLTSSEACSSRVHRAGAEHTSVRESSRRLIVRALTKEGSTGSWLVCEDRVSYAAGGYLEAR